MKPRYLTIVKVADRLPPKMVEKAPSLFMDVNNTRLRAKDIPQQLPLM